MYHATFSPLLYNASAVRAFTEASAALGYDFVRVFIDPGSFERGDGVNGPPDGPQALSAAYIGNLADFIRTAASAGVFTMITLDFPANAHWAAAAGPAPAWCGGGNCEMLAPGSVSAWAEFAGAMVSATRAALGGDAAGVFAWSLANEAAFLDSAPPFSLAAGNISTADGLSYDMSDTASRQQCADANAVHWANTVAAAVRAADAAALVTLGVFTFQVRVVEAAPLLLLV